MTPEYKAKLEEAVKGVDESLRCTTVLIKHSEANILLSIAKDRLSGKLVEPMIEDEIDKRVQSELLPFADANWRKDNFKFDDRVMRMISRNVTNALVGHIAKQTIGREELKTILINLRNEAYSAGIAREVMPIIDFDAILSKVEGVQ